MEPDLVPKKLLENLNLKDIKINSKCVTTTSWKELLCIFLVMGFIITVLYLRYEKPKKKKKKKSQPVTQLVDQPVIDNIQPVNLPNNLIEQPINTVPYENGGYACNAGYPCNTSTNYSY